MTWLVLFADGLRRDPFRTPEVVWGTAGIALALLAGALAVWMLERWRKRAVIKTDAAGELTDYRGMFERGEITEDEYARLRSRVAERAKAAPRSPAGPPPSPSATGLPHDLADLLEEDDDASGPPTGPGNRTPGPDAPTPPPEPRNPTNRPPPA